VKFEFIAAQKANFPVRFMCRQLDVSVSGFYASQGRPESTHAVRDRALAGLVREAHQRSRGAYGSRRVHAALRKHHGQVVGHNRVARLMRENKLTAIRKRRYVRTTDSNHAHPVAPNVLRRQFHADKPNQAWVTDITYIRTAQGWLYLAVILDLFSRRVVGWAMDGSMERGLVLAALHMALAQRRPPASLTHHSDRGSQYASGPFQDQLAEFGMTCSMSRKGNCWDNAPTESFFNSLKNERVHGTRYATHDEARADLFDHIEAFYNRSRRHSTLGYRSPTQYLQHWVAAQDERKLAA
jgi:putative transposase